MATSAVLTGKVVSHKEWLAARTECGELTHELGGRRSIGASKRQLRRYLIAHFGREYLWAFAAGAWSSLFLANGLHAAYPAIPGFDAAVLLEVAAVLLVAGGAGALPSALSALEGTPVRALTMAGLTSGRARTE
jgi:hypothetical protein